MSYTNNIPNATDLISNSQAQIKGNFTAIDSGSTGTGIGFSRNHVTMTDATNGGLHNRVDYYQAVASPTISGFTSSAYAKTTGGISEFFYKNGTADIQLTNSSLTASGGQGMLPGGLLLKTGSGNSGGSTTVTVTFTTAFPTACLAVIPVAQGTDTTQSCQPSSITTTSFVLKTSKTALSYGWIAIGY